MPAYIAPHRIWLAAVLAILAGCGGNTGIAPVTGQITWEGAAVTAGRITFYPDTGRPATAAIQSDGSYVLTTLDEGDGAQVGPHVVTISASRTVGGPAAPKSFEEELKLAQQRPAERPLPRLEWIVPETYSERSTSPLTADVQPGSNTINFFLPQ